MNNNQKIQNLEEKLESLKIEVGDQNSRIQAEPGLPVELQEKHVSDNSQKLFNNGVFSIGLILFLFSLMILGAKLMGKLVLNINIPLLN